MGDYAAALRPVLTPEVSALVGKPDGGPSLLGIGWALLLGWGFGAWLYRLHAPRIMRGARFNAAVYQLLRGAIGPRLR